MPSKVKKTEAEETVKNIPAKFFIGITLFGLGLYIALAMFNFFISGGDDRSIIDISLLKAIEEDVVVENKLGMFGAWIANMLITNGIGIMAFSIPTIMIAFALRLFDVKKVKPFKITLHSLLISIWGSITLGFIFFKLSDTSFILAGGMHGYYVSKWLMMSIGVIGTTILLIFTASIYLSVCVDGFANKIMQLFAKIANRNIPLPHLKLDNSEGATVQPLQPTIDTDNNENEDDDDENNQIENDNTSDTEDNEDDGDKELPNNNDEELTISRPIGDDTDDYASPQSDNDLIITEKTEEEEVQKNLGSLDTPYDPTLELAHYQYPTLDLLEDYQNDVTSEEDEKIELVEKKNKIVETLDNFGIKIQNITATIGPTVTLYEIVPAPGVRISKIQGLQDDIALSLAALGIRIIAPMPGKGTIGIEVPNSKPQVVSMRSMVKSKKFQESTAELPIVMGKTISNEVFMFDLTKTPHLLVAGATGMGKSVGLNAIVTSILYKKHPSQVKFVMVDPKMVEFSIYRKLEKHFMAKMESEDDVIITNVDKVKNTLNSLTVEMDDRYALLTKVDCRNIKEYNKKFINRQLNPEHGHRYLPYIVVIIDEFADLIMTAGKEIETPIARIAQKARAVGIHMILATQRPSAKIITGVIKANFPTQIAFRVGTMVDSRTIIDTTGAQHLIGRGDMLVKMGSDTTRVQCALVDTEEVTKINDFIGRQPGYAAAYPLPEVVGEGEEGGANMIDAGQLDALFAEVARMVVNMQSGSTSNIQRRFSLGYNRAGKLMDQLERAGIVGPAEGSKPRQVLVQTEMELERILQGFGM